MTGHGNSGGPTSSPAFEWDPAKSASNKVKHGVDFDEATAIWQDPLRLVIGSVYTGPEARQLTIGLLKGKIYAAVTTMRDDNVRIISVRRARTQEEVSYGEQPQVNQQ